MNALLTPTGPEDRICMAYGQEVKLLLSASDPASWAEDLWTIYTGFMLAQKELGYDPRIADTFVHSRSCCFSLKGLKKSPDAVRNDLYGRTTPERPMPLLFYSNWHNCFRI
ncbi:hypothetical protein ACWKW6_01315 [Dyadobacter jiangsuensis]